MCGIFGVIQRRVPIDQKVFRDMLGAIVHRGPEDEGSWFGVHKNVALGHRRLAIIDLSPLGHQPMQTPDGRFSITFNGEIYNYQEIKQELEKIGWHFKSQSDTEVLLYAFAAWGAACLDKLNGMFAFAVWDEQEQRLFAARDRLGEKPFKYYFDENCFVFASELKALLAYPQVKRQVDWSAVDLALTYRYVPAPATGFKGIFKLPAGHYLEWHEGQLKIKAYWQPKNFAKVRENLDITTLKNELWSLFKDAVQKRMISDVPVGAFLSGGLDSSSVVAAMAEVSSRPVKTFSVGFKDRPDSETPFAKIVSDRFKTEHTEIIIDPQVITMLPGLVAQYEEPFFDNSAVPTMAMAELTKPHVTVVLTGDGGDECFGGYPNHSFYAHLLSYQRLPSWFYQKAVPSFFSAAAKLTHSRAIGKQWYRSEMLSHPALQAYVDYYGIWQKEFHASHFYLTKEDLYTEEFKKQIDISAAEKIMEEWLGANELKKYGASNQAILADIVSRLSDDYLMKVDFGGMRYAIETRPPFLDHRLIEKSLSLNQNLKIHGGKVKWIWKEVMKNRLPETILTRRKMGFGIPIGDWMKKEMYPYVREKLLSSNTPLYQFCRKSVIERLIEDHKNGLADYSNHIWSLLLLEAWLEKFFSV